MTTRAGGALWPDSLPVDLRERLSRVVARLAQAPETCQVILFGSWAEGRARPDSDLDLLVVADTTERLALTMRLKRVLRPMLAGRGLDLFVIPSAEWEGVRAVRGMVGWEADNFGVRLYDRGL